MMLDGLKKRLKRAKGAWVDEFPHLLWAYRIMSRRPTGKMPFALTNGKEVVIPLEAGLPTMMTNIAEHGLKEKAFSADLHLAEDRRE